MLKINSEISVGNLLTTISILIGAATFFHNEAQKREQTDRAYAAEARGVIGRGASEATRLGNELELFFLSVEPLYVKASEAALIPGSASRGKDAERARDLLWSGVTAARAEMERRILEGTTLPGGLAPVGAAAQDSYEEFRERYERLRYEAFENLLTATQRALQDTAPDAIYTAEIGNALRQAHHEVREASIAEADRIRSEVAAMLAAELERFAR